MRMSGDVLKKPLSRHRGKLVFRLTPENPCLILAIKKATGPTTPPKIIVFFFSEGGILETWP